MNVIATIGPNSSNKKVLYGLINKGVDILRLNFSHFYENEFVRILNDSRSIDKNVKIMADICGKKVRVYEKLKNVYKIYSNDIVYFCSSDVYSVLSNNNDEMKIIPLTIKSEVIENNDIKSISMKDGTMNFEIVDKDKVFLKARVRENGIIRGGKGCNIPGVNLGINYLSNKDKQDIKWAIDNDVDIISQSYVESSSEILDIREYIKEIDGDLEKVRIFSKIETKLGLENYKEIMGYSDGIVIARGDLVPECGIINSVEEEFELLKRMKNNNYKKEIVIATHVLDNMKNGSMATMSELESIYTFINMGVTGFLLAGETSIGKYPIKTVQFLKEIIEVYQKKVDVKH